MCDKIDWGIFDKAEEIACELLSIRAETERETVSEMLYEEFGIHLQHFIYLVSKIEPILNKKKDEK